MIKKRGLILAKFAPFHRCHKFIIKTALKEMDEVYIIMYDCPDKTNIPLHIRANWVRHIFPKVNVIEGWDAPNRHEDTPEVRKMQEEYVKKALNGKKITHFYSADYYGEHMSKSLGAINRRVDEDKGGKRCKIRATLIRVNKYKYRKFVDPMVYKDILIKVAFVGIPSQEQSLLAQNLAKKLGTTFIEDNLLGYLKTKKLTSIDFYKIAMEKYKLTNNMNKIYSANEYIIFNSTGFIDHLLSVATHNQFDKKLSKFFSEDMKSYDLVLVNEVNKNYISKYLNIDNSIFLNQLTSNLKTLGIDYKILSGIFKEKLLLAEKLIKSVERKFS